MHPITRFSFPTTIIYGPGALGELPGALQELSVRKPLVVTDAGFAGTGTYQMFIEVLDNAAIPYAQYAGVQPNPQDKDVKEAAYAYKESTCDCIIGIGGGSPMDTAKAVAVLSAMGGSIGDYDIQEGGGSRITSELPPVIAIPTTAGTGSEVGKCAVITSSSQGRKFMVCHPGMLPKRSILDPQLTVSLPAHLTAATGMDALTHNIESLTSPEFHPMCDGIAVKGIELAVQNLERAVQDPGDIDARGFMMLASMMGAVAFQKDLGACHSLSHALSAVCALQHGLANAVCLVPVMQFNLDAASRQYQIVAACFGVRTQDMSEKEAAMAAIERIKELNRSIGIPVSLKELGVRKDQFDEIVEKAYRDPCHATNPKPCTKEDLKLILQNAWEG